MPACIAEFAEPLATVPAAGVGAEPVGAELVAAPDPLPGVPMVALANNHWPALAATMPAVLADPLVPVGVGVGVPRCRQPVTVIVRLDALPFCDELD